MEGTMMVDIGLDCIYHRTFKRLLMFLISGAFKNALTTPVSSVALPISINTIAKPYRSC